MIPARFAGALARFARLVFLIGLVCMVGSSCRSTTVDLRKLAPKDTLIYLEANDLGKVLSALTESEAFKANSETASEFSAANGFQIAIAVTGFETSEKQVTEQQSILNFKPKFVAIAETHAWSWQIDPLINGTFNNFFRKIYGEDVRMEVATKNGLNWYTWVALDERKTYAVVSGSQIFLGNDEESIKKCLSAKRGESESLRENARLVAEYEKGQGSLAFGFIGNEGVKKIADLAGVTAAVGQSEDENVRSLISQILPQILKNTTKEITWVAKKTSKGIEDKLFIRTEKEVSNIFSETIVAASGSDSSLHDFLPPEAISVTRYSLKSPQIAYRSVLLVAAKSTDPLSGKLIAAFSNSLLEPYGIENAEEFLSAVGSNIVTAGLDVEGENAIAIMKTQNREVLIGSLSKEIDVAAKPGKNGDAEIWRSKDGKLTVAFIREFVVLGNSESVSKGLAIYKRRKISPIEADKDFTKSPPFSLIATSDAAASTLYSDSGRIGKMVNVLGKPKSGSVIEMSQVIVETKFEKTGIVRRYLSDFGFIGTLIEQFEN